MEDKLLAETLRHEYQAALQRLHRVVQLCPPDVWNKRSKDEAPFWQVAMHLMFHTRGFLCESMPSAEASGNAALAMQQLGLPKQDSPEDEIGCLLETIGNLSSPSYTPARIVTRDELLERADNLLTACASAMKRLAEGKASSPDPMPWRTGNALGLLLYNLRHIEYHVGQLASYLSRHAKVILDWQ